MPSWSTCRPSQLGLAKAKVDPDSLLGQTVVTAAEPFGLSDPDDVADTNAS
jgi:hypothetical protein